MDNKMPNTESKTQDGKVSSFPVGLPLKGELSQDGHESVDSNSEAHTNRVVEGMKIPSIDSTKLLEKKEYPKDMLAPRKPCQLSVCEPQQCEGIVGGTLTLRPKLNSDCQIVQAVMNSYMVSPERDDESSLELVAAAKLSQSKSSYFGICSSPRHESFRAQTHLAESAQLELPGSMTYITPRPQQTLDTTTTNSLGADEQATCPDEPEGCLRTPHFQYMKAKSLDSIDGIKTLQSNPGSPNNLCSIVSEQASAAFAKDGFGSPIQMKETIKRAVSFAAGDSAVLPPVGENEIVHPWSKVPLPDVGTATRQVTTISFGTPNIKSVAWYAPNSATLKEAIVQSPSTFPAAGSSTDDDHQALLQVAKWRIANDATSMTVVDSTPPPTRMVPGQPPVLQQQHSSQYVDTTPLHIKSTKRPLRDVDVEAFMRQVLRAPNKKRGKQCQKKSLAVKPLTLQPRVSSSYSLTDDFDELKHVDRSVAVSYYRFGSPRPISHLLTQTPMTTAEPKHNDWTPQNLCHLTPPGILRKTSACSADWGFPALSVASPATSSINHDLLADFQQPGDDGFFLQPPHLLRRASPTSQVGKRPKVGNFDEFSGETNEDFMCLDLFNTFME